MKIKIILLLLLFGVLKIKGQFSSTGADSKQFKAFDACASINVVLSGDKVFDDGMKEAMKTSWNLKPVQYIDKTAFDTDISDETKAFMMLVTIVKEGSNQNYHFLAIMMGGKKKLSKYSYDDMVAYCPINALGGEMPLTKSYFRLPILVYQLQSTINLIKKNTLNGGSFSLGKTLTKLYYENADKIKTKTLLINTDAANIKFTEAEVKEVYKYPVEFCNNAKVAEAIKNRDAKYAILQPGITLNKFIMVFDAATYDCLYSSIDMMGLKVKIGDLKEISEAIKK